MALGGDLQAALDKAQPGDTISLQAGAVFSGPFVLAPKRGAGWITIESSAIGSELAEGHRVSPADSVYMPKLEADSGTVLAVAAGAHNYRLIGIEIRPVPARRIDNLVLMGDNVDSLREIPRYLIFDRCYIHGDPQVGTRRGIAMNAAYAAVINSHLSDFKRTDVDAQTIDVWNGPGPFLIANNYLEASGENILFGGADPSIAGLVPSDIEILGNHFSKPRAWKSGDPSYQGIPWSVKNILELKNAQRVLIKGNLFEFNWAQSQNGYSILFTVRNQDGSAPWSAVRDVTFVDNVLRHATNGINILGYDDNFASAQTQRILVENNLFYDVGYDWSGGALLQMLDGTLNIHVVHNTALQSGSVTTADGRPNHGFLFASNIVLNNRYGIIGTDTGQGNGTLKRYFPDSEVTGNVFIGGSASNYPAGNYFPATSAELEFRNEAAHEYQLAATSPYKDKAKDGSNPGADIQELCKALNIANPPLSVQVPTCSPVN